MSQSFLRKKTLILQKKVSGVDKVVNFKDFSFKTLQRNQVLFKDLKRIQGVFLRRLIKFKTFSRLYEPWKMVYKRVRGWTLGRSLPI